MTAPRTTIDEIGAHQGRDVLLLGWMYNRRSSKKIHFLQLRDGTGAIQGVVVKNEVSEEVWERSGAATMESSVAVVGEVRADDRAPSGYELGVKDVQILNLAQDYPISKKEHGVDFLLDHRHLWIRSLRQRAILRVRAQVISAARGWLDGEGFTLVDSPIFTPNACEGTSTLFETEYFGDKAYLSQSGQLYNEATAMALGRVYCFGPTFRAEKSKTRRHLTEFWMLEPEMAFCDWEENMAIQERFLSAVVSRVVEKCRPDLTLLGREVEVLEKIQPPFPRISFREAATRLNEIGHKVDLNGDFGAEDETALSEQFDKPVMVHHFPAAVKAFYMKPDPGDSTLALCNDVLAPEGYGEIIGGGQRMDDLGMLEAALDKHELPHEPFQWYLDLRRYGSVPHSGFGIGVERTVAWLCKLPHVRETIPFPRTIYRCTP